MSDLLGDRHRLPARSRAVPGDICAMSSSAPAAAARRNFTFRQESGRPKVSARQFFARRKSQVSRQRFCYQQRSRAINRGDKRLKQPAGFFDGRKTAFYRRRERLDRKAEESLRALADVVCRSVRADGHSAFTSTVLCPWDKYLAVDPNGAELSSLCRTEAQN